MCVKVTHWANMAEFHFNGFSMALFFICNVHSRIIIIPSWSWHWCSSDFALCQTCAGIFYICHCTYWLFKCHKACMENCIMVLCSPIILNGTHIRINQSNKTMRKFYYIHLFCITTIIIIIYYFTSIYICDATTLWLWWILLLSSPLRESKWRISVFRVIFSTLLVRDSAVGL